MYSTPTLPKWCFILLCLFTGWLLIVAPQAPPEDALIERIAWIMMGMSIFVWGANWHDAVKEQKERDDTGTKR